MSWSAHLTHTPTDVAEHFASLLAVEARHRLAGVVAELAGNENDYGHPLCCDCSSWLNGDPKGTTE